MDVSRLDLMSGRLSGVDDVRVDGEDLVFSLSVRPGDGEVDRRDDESFVEIANLVKYPSSGFDAAPRCLYRGLRDSAEMLSILASTVKTEGFEKVAPDELLAVAKSIGPLFGSPIRMRGEIREPIALWYWAANLFSYTVRLRDVEMGRAHGIGLEAGLATAFEIRGSKTEKKSLIAAVPLCVPDVDRDVLAEVIGPVLAFASSGAVVMPLDETRRIDDSEVASYRFGRRGELAYPPLVGCVIGRAQLAEYCLSQEDERGLLCLGLPGGNVVQLTSGPIDGDSADDSSDELSMDQRIASELLQAMVLFFTGQVRLGWVPVRKPGGNGLSFRPTFSSTFERLWCCLGEWYPEDALRRCPYCGRVFSTLSGRTKTYCSSKCQIAEKSARQYRRTINKELPRDVR